MRLFKSCFGLSHKRLAEERADGIPVWHDQNILNMLEKLFISMGESILDKRCLDEKDITKFYASIHGVLAGHRGQLGNDELYILMQILRYKEWAHMHDQHIDKLWIRLLKNIRDRSCKDTMDSEYPYMESSLPRIFVAWLNEQHQSITSSRWNFNQFIHDHSQGFSFEDFQEFVKSGKLASKGYGACLS